MGPDGNSSLDSMMLSYVLHANTALPFLSLSLLQYAVGHHTSTPFVVDMHTERVDPTQSLLSQQVESLII